VSSGLERAIAEEAGAKVGDVLWVDGLGPADSGADTYVTAMATNALEIVAGLSRDGASCEKLAEMRDMARAGS
jgi:ABC-type Zn uptake system ZnuABC Zn-binding protein ZnuA